MSGRNQPDLLGVLKTLVARIITALRASGGAFRAKPKTPKTGEDRFGDYETIEKAKYRAPAPSPPSLLEDGELPESYGETKVVLLVVNPYLVHVYWDFDPAKLPYLQPQRTSALLRFYDTTGAPPSICFDVEVELQARNWYVHLWSPDKSYHVELGVSTEGAGFTPLARSNTVQTPRAWPVSEVGHQFIRAGESPQRIEAGAPRPVESLSLQMPVPPVESQSGESPGMAKPPAELAASVGERLPGPRPPQPVDAAEVLRRTLSELYVLRQWRPQPVESPVSFAPGPSLSAKWDARGDLTTLTEQQFCAGLSSALLGSQGTERPAG